MIPNAHGSDESLKGIGIIKVLRQQQDKSMALFIRTLKRQPEVLDAWDETIWTVMEKGIVHKNGHITFVFYNGTKIEVGAE